MLFKLVIFQKCDTVENLDFFSAKSQKLLTESSDFGEIFFNEGY